MHVPRPARSLSVFFAAVLLLALAAPSARATPVLPHPNSHGITLDSLTEVNGDPRMLDAVVSTAAIFEPVHVRIYLPSTYNNTGDTTRYDSLYLLHGANDPLDGALPWADTSPDSGQIATTLATSGSPFNGIVVMPDGGKSGFYTDWTKGDKGGRRPLWETFHIQQLIPWIDDNFRTSADRMHRTVAGLSMGGFGALSYAARHPDLFSAVGAFSPPSNIRTDIGAREVVVANNLTLISGSAITAAEQPVNGGDGSYLAADIKDVFGDPETTWTRLNPLDLVSVYKAQNIKLALYSGSGLDAAHGLDLLEAAVKGQSDTFHGALNNEGFAHRYCQGTGTHHWEYWRADLKDFLNYRYGTTPATCPNGWGAPKP
ncbi:alpha/beta hydrolase-fold protein [Actinomadura rayongensis]|uniref:Esterase family protein n=1 Tax=Actinomadura rayongensis TaxID=1429076 RepID=A0A6I4W7F7_9ACTN|nr:hypothetical protein [Actinomadura rayongensis]